MTQKSKAQIRKEYPVFEGVLKYFPDAIKAVSHVSFVGNEQHHHGEPLWWDKTKSTDNADACMRHLIDSIQEEFDTDGVRHLEKAAWRILATLQVHLDKQR